MSMQIFIRILIVFVSITLLAPALSTAQMMKDDQMMPQSYPMDKKDMEEMHSKMPRMMRHMMEMMHEMMGMMEKMVWEEEDREKLEGMMQHMERMMKSYDEKMKDKKGEMSRNEESNALIQMSEAGGVAVAVTYLNPREDSPAFEVKFDTHSVDLDQYKLESIVFLRDDAGKEYSTPVVESSTGSGHHISGMIRFKDVGISKAKMVTLVIKDVAGVKERVFSFERGVEGR